MKKPAPGDPPQAWDAWLREGAEWLRVIGALLLITGLCALVLVFWP
ncbi:hypothetical protein I6A60_01980 [Frankia sp. AgB1.9]|nr:MULTISPECIES: hypothetical protein [unclassified Frankia]MBL7490479.1 hypothetical protein [Frankia sp. AgW1.1]MBL7546655.1 hypothetical protein [Frankia sp. AgB1.9]MBL7624675.1 hypothetical protein [Frankia sp. AgB1.8]